MSSNNILQEISSNVKLKGIISPKKFVSLADQCNRKISIQFVSMTEINKNGKIMEKRWLNVKVMPNIQ